jgi:aminoglycoside 6'-N-acetyltransferase
VTTTQGAVGRKELVVFTFRRVTRDDFGLLASWLAQSYVHEWWAHEYSPEAVERDFGPGVGR